MSAPLRRRRERHGWQAERWVAWWLRLRGYRVLARRWQSPVGEIDLIVARGRVIAFVEVKRRPTLEAALASLQPRQLARIARAAEAYLQRRADRDRLEPRIDLVATAPWRWPRHLRGLAPPTLRGTVARAGP